MNWKKFNGFSLMEMMVVLLIVAIVMAASAPMISRKMVGGGGGSCHWSLYGINGSIGFNTQGNNNLSVHIGHSTKGFGTNNMGIPKLRIASNAAESPQLTLSGDSGELGARVSAMSIMVSQNDNGFAIRPQKDGTMTGGGVTSNATIGANSLSIGVGTAARNDGSIAIGLNSLASANNAIAIGATNDDSAGGNPEAPSAIDMNTAVQPANPMAFYNKYNDYTLANLVKGAKEKLYSMMSGFQNINGLPAYATDVGQNVNNVQVAPVENNIRTKAMSDSSIAIGMRAHSNGTSTISIGTDSRAAGNNNGTFSAANGAIAIGYGASANNHSAIAIGRAANAVTDEAVAIGSGAEASAHPSLAIGPKTVADQEYTQAVGIMAHARGKSSLAIGIGVQVTGERSIAIGLRNRKNGTVTILRANDSIAIGTGAQAGPATGTPLESDCIAIGEDATATGDMSTAVGYSAEASASNATAYGHHAQAKSANSTAVGYSATAGECASAFGHKATAHDYGIAIGREASAGHAGAGETSDSIAIGYKATATDDMATAIGYNANAQLEAVAFGHDAHAKTQCVAIGREAIAGTGHANNDSIAVGFQADATGDMAIAIGYKATANQGSTTAFGHSAQSTTYGASSYGYSAEAKGQASCAFGYWAQAHGDRSIAIGNGAQAKGKDSIAIGYTTHAIHDNEVAIGNENSTVDIYGHSLTVHKDLCVNGNIYYQGTILINSDRRLKNVGEVYKAGLNELKKLDFYHYTFKKDKNKTPRVGVMAQDLQKIFPDAVIKGEDGFLQIRLEDMFYAVINAVKELDTRLTELSAQVKSNIDLTAKLQAKVDSQQKEIAELRKMNAEIKKMNADFEKRLKNLEKKAK